MPRFKRVFSRLLSNCQGDTPSYMPLKFYKKAQYAYNTFYKVAAKREP